MLMMLSWDRLLAVLATAARCLQGKPQQEVRNVPWDAAGKECGHNITCCLGLAQIYVDVAATLDTTEDVVEKNAMTDTNIVGLVFLLVPRL